jgi:hypothetical protein
MVFSRVDEALVLHLKLLFLRVAFFHIVFFYSVFFYSVFFTRIFFYITCHISFFRYRTCFDWERLQILSCKFKWNWYHLFFPPWWEIFAIFCLRFFPRLSDKMNVSQVVTFAFPALTWPVFLILLSCSSLRRQKIFMIYCPQNK